jgi:hypothetical protein
MSDSAKTVHFPVMRTGFRLWSASGANGVHAEIGYDAMSQQDHLAVLTADLHDRLRSRHAARGGDDLAGDFILDDVSADDGSRQVASAAGSANATNRRIPGPLGLELRQSLLYGPDGFALGSQVDGVDELAPRVNQGQFDGH